MSLNIGDNFKYLGKKFLDSRESFATLADMKKCTQVPNGFLTYCQEDGKRYEFNSSNTINELTGQWAEFVINQDIDDCYYMGIEEPETDKIWFYNDREASIADMTYDNPLIAELFACIQSLQSQITQLQAEVEYLKINGGGGMPSEPPDGGEDDDIVDVSIYLALEDGSLFELEEGGHIILEQELVIVKESILVLEDGCDFLLEDGGRILLEKTEPSVEDSNNLILLESGGRLLLENDKYILLEK